MTLIAAASDHPRIRGDHDEPIRARDARLGPPPHSRGSHPIHRLNHGDEGTTPAFAGITSSSTPSAGSTKDHPRIRGDHIANTLTARSEIGPPPHSRGSPRLAPSRSLRRRTTPAFAGITAGQRRSRPGASDHPRIRGDHPRRRISQRGPSRTTPAFAGITPAPTSSRRWSEDHPRIRGDHTLIIPGKVDDVGPPPHSRGSPERPENDALLCRTTPAFAGITVACPPATGATGGPPPHSRGSR